MPFHLFRRRRQAARETTAACQRASQPGPRQPLSAMVHGRRFLTEIPYVLPKDRAEIDRLDFQHFLLKQALGRNYLPPLNCLTASILDVGCGTGRWGHEMAREFKHAQVVGLDLEEMRACPDTSGLLNYHFTSGNILSALPFASDSFDYVHQRLLVAGIPLQSWPSVISELIRVTRPVGWIELVEAGTEVRNLGPLTQSFLAWGVENSTARGLDAREVPRLGAMMRAAGLRSLHERTIDIPMGEWGGRVGVMMKEDLLSVFASLKALYTSNENHVDAEREFTRLLEQMPAEWERRHSFYRFFAFYARK